MIKISGHTGFIGQHLSRMLGNAAMGVNLRESDGVYLGVGDALVHLAGMAHDVKKAFAAEEYFAVNTALTKKLFDQFLASEASVFVFMSTVKACEGKDKTASAYSQSKYMAEQYILSKEIPDGKRVYILRPVMVHGPANKGNLNLLFGVVKKGFPWPLAAFENKRSFVSVENLCFVVKALIESENVPSGVYAVADSDAFSTNELVRMAGDALGKKVIFWRLPKGLVRFGAAVGSMLGLPLNTERLEKLTENAVVDNGLLLKVLGKSLPLTAREGFEKTFKSFVHHDQ
jgi:nucleoside-diphosphate-sugar epimerase